jgi:hypothetical protein
MQMGQPDALVVDHTGSGFTALDIHNLDVCKTAWEHQAEVVDH